MQRGFIFGMVVGAKKPRAKEPPGKPEPRAKKDVFVESGRRGGLKGGRARAEKLSPERRREIAQKAAEARWIKASQR